MLKKSMNLTLFSALAALLAVSLPLAGNAADKSAVNTEAAQPAAQSSEAQPMPPATADARHMATIVPSRAAMPAAQQMKAPAAARPNPARAVMRQDARQPKLDDRQFAAMAASRSAARLPSQAMNLQKPAAVNASPTVVAHPAQAMKTEKLAAMNPARSTVVRSSQMMNGGQTAATDIASAAPSDMAALTRAAILKSPGKALSPLRMSPEKAAAMQKAMTAPPAKSQIKYSTHR